MKLKRILISLALLVNGLVMPMMLVPQVAHAAVDPPVVAADNCFTGNKKSSFFGFPTWYKYVLKEDCEFDKDLELKDVKSLIVPIALAIFEIILRVAGLVAVGFVIAGGFEFITSQGEPDKIKHARGTIINALVGLVIAISATVIVNLTAGIFT